MKIIIGSDHGGFEYKEKLKEWLISKKYEISDVGANELNMDDDYPIFAKKLCKKVLNDNSKGILLCGSGLGMCMAANKLKGIRAVTVYDKYTAKMSRRDNDANVICLRGREADFKKMKSLVELWLNSEFSGLDRYKKRNKML